MLEISKNLPTEKDLNDMLFDSLECLNNVILNLKLLQIDRIYNTKPNQEIIISHIENINNMLFNLNNAKDSMIRDLKNLEII